jgi:hypothetical protein
MTHSIDNYYSEIRSDIAKEFGLESAGYAPNSNYVIPIRIAQRIAEKYPTDYSKGRFNATLNPQAVAIAKRYVAIMSVLKKGGN